jgi:predicted transposase YdaD
MSVLQVHDKFVDQLFSNQKNLTDFIKGYLPRSLVTRLDLSTVRLKNIFSELSKFKVLLLRLRDVDRETIGFIMDYVVRAREGSKEEMEKMLKEVGMPTIAEQWIQEGIQQGIQQGLLLDAQEMVLEVLEERFGVISKSIAHKIKQIDSREVVKSLFRLAMRVDSLEEFEAKLKIAMN